MSVPLSSRIDTLQPAARFTGPGALRLPSVQGGSVGPNPVPHRELPHAATSGSREFPALAGGRFRPGGGLTGATGQHGTKFGNLGVDMPLLFLESKDRCGDDFRGELLYWHVSLSHHPR